MFWSQQYAVEHSAALVMAALLLAVARAWPRAGRVLYLALFAWACSVNWRTALEQPQVYLEYGDLALLGIYRDFIRGLFASHIVLFVGTIATCQGLIAVGLFAGGALARYALAGATLFLVMIAPLGVGSGFPSTLIMAVGCVSLLRTPGALERSLLAQLGKALAARSARAAVSGGNHD